MRLQTTAWDDTAGQSFREESDMHNLIRSSLLILSLGAALPLVIQGESRAGGRHCCGCQTCRQPCGMCTCAVQHACPTCQERDVVATEYRNEQTLETVPVTVMENVTVDEGSYQTVWVPRLTTKAVARTVYQTRTACRTVPYQVTRRINDCTTPTTLGSFPSSSYTSAILPPVYSGSSIAAGSYPTPVASRITPTPVAGSPIGISPAARLADAPVTPITPRSASIMPRSGSSASGTRIAERSSLFVPAPSAAQVWRSTVVR
ncbi:MAG: hypothetical protein HY290_27890 [Planctomycetia bacterium]|nr:hypothetical protein [Planctomycetia bacterium]